MQVPPLTQSVGSAERAMRVLLERYLRDAGLSFPAWIALVFTNGSLLTVEQIAQRQINGHVVPDVNAVRQTIDILIATGLVAADESNMLTHTDEGARLFEEIDGKVKKIIQALYGDLPAADLETTHQTLLEIASRANSLITSSKP